MVIPISTTTGVRPDAPAATPLAPAMRALALALFLTGCAASAPATAQPLDLDDPADAVRAMQKIQCSLEDGEPAVYYFEGDAYSRVPGERDRHLFGYQAFNVRACQSLPDAEGGYGFRLLSREVLFYQDPRTGETLRTWTNPWTDEEVEVLHVANDPVNNTFAAAGRRGPFSLGATFADGTGWIQFQVPLFYTNPLGGDYQDYVGGAYQAIEMFTFFFDEADVRSAADDEAEGTTVAWSRMSQWLPWMKMGSRVGYLVFSGAGKRLEGGYDALPAAVRDEVAARYPAYTAPPPLDDDRPNATSWTVFKEYLDAQRAGDGD